MGKLLTVCLLISTLSNTPSQLVTAIENTIPQVSQRIEEVVVLSKLLYGEYRGDDVTKQAAVIWCVLNRVDAGFGDIIEVATAPNQFTGYREDNPIEPELVVTVLDVLRRWSNDDIGRVLPKEYLWFRGNGKENRFRSTWEDTGVYWDWSLISPYAEQTSS